MPNKLNDNSRHKFKEAKYQLTHRRRYEAALTVRLVLRLPLR